MSRRHTPTALAFILLSTAACSDDTESSENAQSADSGTDASVDAGAEKPSAGRGGGGRGGATAGGAGGKGGRGAARDAGAGEEDTEEQGEENEGGKGGQGDKGGKGGQGGSTPEEEGGAGGTAGNATAGSGGAAGNATAGAGGTAGTSAPNDDDAGVTDPQPQGPHLKTATLQGHLWLAFSGAGTTLTATGYDTPVVSGPVCIQGSVAATPDYNSNAAIGLNLNQLPNEVPMPFTPTLGGLQIDVANRVGSPLRILIQTQDGTGLWCANVNGAGGYIAWTDFNTACWDGSGTAYALQPLAVASVQVPGGIDAAIAYDFCLNGLTETAAPAAPTTPTTPTTPAPIRADSSPL